MITWLKYQLDRRRLRQARKAITAVTRWLPLGYCRNLGELVPVKGGIISSSLSLIKGNRILPITPRDGCGIFSIFSPFSLFSWFSLFSIVSIFSIFSQFSQFNQFGLFSLFSPFSLFSLFSTFSLNLNLNYKTWGIIEQSTFNLSVSQSAIIRTRDTSTSKKGCIWDKCVFCFLVFLNYILL